MGLPLLLSILTFANFHARSLGACPPALAARGFQGLPSALRGGCGRSRSSAGLARMSASTEFGGGHDHADEPLQVMLLSECASLPCEFFC